MKHSIVTLLLVSLLPVSAFAWGGTSQGTYTAGLSFGLESPTLLGDEIDVELHGGYYTSNALQFGLTGMYRDDAATTEMQITALVQYHFLDSILVDENGAASAFSPFVGLLLGYGSGENPVQDETGAVAGIRLGFDVFLTQNIALYLKGDCMVSTGDVYPDDLKMKNSKMTLSAGFHFFF